MKRAKCFELVAAAGLLALAAGAAEAQTAEMTFFVTSVGSGRGADLGGIDGADAICQRLAQASGAGGKTWRAYLSTQAAGGAAAVNARDRIGAGPWRNAKGAVIASSVADLHGGAANLTKQTALNEKGEPVNGRGDTPNQHDMLTGSQPDGTAFGPGEDRTCGNYTKSGTEGAVMVGHHDRTGLDESPPAKSWNTSHPSRGGCSQDALRSTGGAGLFYCFASN
ncbi:hypothetical protein G3545_09315 [Starkeya sp. ORNL1]|uniref:hypothetical protein n=1 Tax=Starkeya sp. ORNL1 TaxID=2709380 RepID=UPI001462EAC6|nr:hypothetical protein [Starkeya sp. ORNL1]QJP13838.1 hypothetical protein G3545_09315 [Starkeya sp. ORNL1]